MTIEEARIYADNMTYEDAIYNLAQARCIPYRKATFIKIESLLNDLKELKAYRETKPTDAIDLVKIKEYPDSYNDVPETNVGKIGKNTNVTTTNYISREAVIKTISEWLFSKEFHYTNATEYLRKRLDELPFVTPHQKMGKWEKRDVRGQRVDCCSVCGLSNGTIYEYNYCPNCGAEMRGDAE